MNILIVEDSQIFQRAHSINIANLGHTSYVVESAEQCLKLLSDNPNTYDLVLMDVHLPGQSGYEATAAIKAAPALTHLPVIIVSCSDSDADYIQAKQCGAAAFLQKPVSKQKLLQTCAKLVGKFPHQDSSLRSAL